MALPKKLEEIVEFLQQKDIPLSQEDTDWQINAKHNEYKIVDILKKEEARFSIEQPSREREWYDFGFYDEGSIFCPVNIKVSTTRTADNLNCKLGIYYALTGKEPNDFSNEINWNDYFNKLKNDLSSNNRDYYFLIINKDNTKDVFATSLKCLEFIVPNGNNLPFQAKWDNNRNLVERNFDEATSFLLSKLGESLKLRADAYLHFHKCFSQVPINYHNSYFDFYIECDYCGQRNHCYISHTINGKIITHCRCNKE
ncbi:Restriction endonuclease Hpy8I [Helicobacter trogontum]|uniref:Restriction endonuclease Hpy8I n=1 Tax=Helicobacter trogontum TaxID=50960 RepID=A0ABQ0D617_9HELI